MMKERTFLECIETLAEQFYEKTEDKWYLILKDEVSRKLEGFNNKWWRTK